MQFENQNSRDKSDEGIQTLYSDDFLSAFWKPGEGDLICSFGDLTTKLNGTRFYADKPIIKNGWPCLAFVAAYPNWYPEISMKKAILAAQSIIDGSSNTLSYGSSMGAYAAIKYSKAIKAKTTVALCPQFTLDQSHSDSIDIGWQQHFTKSMTGMEIKSDDCYGNIYIISDHYWEKDHWHATKIKNVFPSAIMINMPWVCHNVTPVLAGSQKLKDIFTQARNTDLQNLKRSLSRFRRNSPIRVRSLLDQATPRHLSLIAPIAARQSASQVLPRRIANKLRRFIPKELRKSKNQRDIASFKVAMSSYFPIYAACLLEDAHPSESHGVIVTAHGKKLAISENLENLDQCRIDEDFYSVRVEIQNTKAALYVSLSCAKFYIGLRADGSFSTENWEDQNDGPWFEYIAQPGGKFSLRKNGKYLSARKSGLLLVAKDQPLDWERFKFGISKPFNLKELS